MTKAEGVGGVGTLPTPVLRILGTCRLASWRSYHFLACVWSSSGT